ncbi:MAG: DUF4105 domain-containing protein [Verrucomicrobiaceae bacterium]|nr:DUF4105 domain-containing protein [Verrucomicrobiaceae bacterium]
MKLVVRVGKKLGSCLVWLLLLLAAAWAFGALHFDFPVFRDVIAGFFVVGVGMALFLPRGFWKRTAWAFALCGVVLAWWLTLTPRADRNWQPDVAELPWAEIQGDEVTLHNVRHFDYRTATDFTPRWETRTMRLSQLTGVDMFVNYWGSPWMAHPIVSFQFADAQPICFSIETRKEVGEKYSAIGGLYRQFELYVVVADERDVIRLRTSIRPGEESYLYRTLITPEKARERFMEYVTTLNELRTQPRWYNAITTNCTTAIRGQHPAGKRLPWDWRILVNGKADSLLYERGYIETGGLPFAVLREKALINPAARAADQSTDFSRLIRVGRPGFDGTRSE